MPQPSPLLKFMRAAHNPDLPLPRYETAGAAGMDLRACLPEGALQIAPGQIALVPTGLHCALPPGTEMQIRPRSGLAVRHGLTVVNAPGTVDEDYRGEIRIGLINLGPEPVTIEHGDRVAQAVLAPVLRARVQEVSSLDDTARGQGGFGSTKVRD